MYICLDAMKCAQISDRDITRGNFFSTKLVNHICCFGLPLSWTATLQEYFLFILDNSQIFNYIQKFHYLMLDLPL